MHDTLSGPPTHGLSPRPRSQLPRQRTERMRVHSAAMRPKMADMLSPSRATPTWSTHGQRGTRFGQSTVHARSPRGQQGCVGEGRGAVRTASLRRYGSRRLLARSSAAAAPRFRAPSRHTPQSSRAMPRAAPRAVPYTRTSVPSSADDSCVRPDTVRRAPLRKAPPPCAATNSSPSLIMMPGGTGEDLCP